MLKTSGLFDNPDPEILVVGYGKMKLSQAKKKVQDYLNEMQKYAQAEKWDAVAHFAYTNGVLKAVLEAIRKTEEESGAQMKTSKVRLDPSVKRTFDAYVQGHPYVRSVPMEELQRIFVQGGYVLLQEDGTPWAGFISCPFEKDIRVTIPIGSLNGEAPEPNKQYPEIGAYLVLTCYKMQSGNIELTAYLT